MSTINKINCYSTFHQLKRDPNSIDFEANNSRLTNIFNTTISFLWDKTKYVSSYLAQSIFSTGPQYIIQNFDKAHPAFYFPSFRNQIFRNQKTNQQQDLQQISRNRLKAYQAFFKKVKTTDGQAILDCCFIKANSVRETLIKKGCRFSSKEKKPILILPKNKSNFYQILSDLGIKNSEIHSYPIKDSKQKESYIFLNSETEKKENEVMVFTTGIGMCYELEKTEILRQALSGKNVLTYNPRGYARSRGITTPQGLKTDAQSIAQYVQKKLKPDSITFFGDYKQGSLLAFHGTAYISSKINSRNLLNFVPSGFLSTTSQKTKLTLKLRHSSFESRSIFSSDKHVDRYSKYYPEEIYIEKTVLDYSDKYPFLKKLFYLLGKIAKKLITYKLIDYFVLNICFKSLKRTFTHNYYFLPQPNIDFIEKQINSSPYEQEKIKKSWIQFLDYFSPTFSIEEAKKIPNTVVGIH